MSIFGALFLAVYQQKWIELSKKELYFQEKQVFFREMGCIFSHFQQILSKMRPIGLIFIDSRSTKISGICQKSGNFREKTLIFLSFLGKTAHFMSISIKNRRFLMIYSRQEISQISWKNDNLLSFLVEIWYISPENTVFPKEMHCKCIFSLKMEFQGNQRIFYKITRNLWFSLKILDLSNILVENLRFRGKIELI